MYMSVSRSNLVTEIVTKGVMQVYLRKDRFYQNKFLRFQLLAIGHTVTKNSTFNEVNKDVLKLSASDFCDDQTLAYNSTTKNIK